jgi:hypothetical protein
MQDLEKLKASSLEELLFELRSREAEAKAAPASEEAAAPGAGAAAHGEADRGRDPALREVETARLAETILEMQKGIYGVDDRMDLFEVQDQEILRDADCVAALFRSNRITDNGDGTSTLRTRSFEQVQNLCAGERFRRQPVGAFCSGFLVAPKIIATAGHCADHNDVTTIRFVFGFRMQDATTAQTVIRNSEIYSGVRIIGRQLVSSGADWALVELDREVTGHRVARVRRAGRIPNNQSVHVIGHPSGLPIKFADGAIVRDNQPSAFFVANLDTYGGNSGSPVFNSDTHEVEGILVRGERDFVASGDCMISLVCPTTGCRGEDCTRASEFQQLIP